MEKEKDNKKLIRNKVKKKKRKINYILYMH